MELYLDSADIDEIKTVFDLGFVTGLTTTPTFMHRHGIKDIDGMIVELSKIVPILQIEALGETSEEIVAEAKRQDELGLDRDKTVYKIPISLQGLKACKILRNEGFRVNIHLIYTLQQAYMALEAGANYVCPLIGRLQDQGTDALSMVAQIVETVNHYGYDSKVMFSSVRNVEHIRNAIEAGVHSVTVPWKVMRQLTENHFTDIGTQQFFEHTRLMTVKVRDVISSKKPIVNTSATISECLLKMTSEGFGAVALVDDKNQAIGIFTDGDMRRLITDFKGEDVLGKNISELTLKRPLAINTDDLLIDAQKLLSDNKVDQLIVESDGKVVGMLDIQDVFK